MIPHARQIFYASAPDKHYRMLLQVMPHPRNIGVDLVAVGEPHARDLAKRRVGFLGRRSLPLGELSLLTGIIAFCQSPAGAWAAAGSAFSNSSSAGKPSTRVSIRLYLGRPVPAGIRRPIITFSLSPTSRSTLPFIAASVSTRVVSWNEAAEMKLSVESEALVIPSNSGSAIAGASGARSPRCACR